MTNLFTVFVSYISLSLGYQIYRSPPEVSESAPFISLLIFLTALLLLLIHLEVYPSSLRCLGWFGMLVVETWRLKDTQYSCHLSPCFWRLTSIKTCSGMFMLPTLLGQCFRTWGFSGVREGLREEACVFFQFLISYFLMENLMIDFWFPLEEAVSQLPSKIADGLEEMLSAIDWSCGSLCDTLRSDKTKVAASYMMSSMLLFMVLHATKLIDFRKLRQGPSCFFGDISLRLKLNLSKIMQDLGLCPEKRVKISDSCGKKEQPRNPCDGNTSSNSNSSRLGGDEHYDKAQRYTRRRGRRRCK